MILTLKESRKVWGKVIREIPQEKIIHCRLPYSTTSFDTHDGYLENYRQYYNIREWVMCGNLSTWATLKDEYNENRPTYQFIVHYNLYEKEISEIQKQCTLEQLESDKKSLEKRLALINKLIPMVEAEPTVVH